MVIRLEDVRVTMPEPHGLGGRLAAARQAPDACSLSRLFCELAAEGQLDLPLPGAGRTRERWHRLAAIGAADLSLARLVEGHTDAHAILAELGGRDPGSALLGVWAAATDRVRATRTPRGWQLDGTMPYCSGAPLLDTALVTARAEDGARCFLVPLRRPGITPVPGSWPALGMAASRSLDVRFDGVALDRGAAVGGPDKYVGRPGFWIGGMGVAACWAGGARGLVDDLLRALGGRDPDAHRLAHLGAVTAAVAGAEAVLDHAAAEVDAHPHGHHRRLALTVRHLVEQAAQEVLVRAARAGGSYGLTHDAAHARRHADLTVYVRQQQAEKDLVALGREALDAAGYP